MPRRREVQQHLNAPRPPKAPIASPRRSLQYLYCSWISHPKRALLFLRIATNQLESSRCNNYVKSHSSNTEDRPKHPSDSGRTRHSRACSTIKGRCRHKKGKENVEQKMQKEEWRTEKEDKCYQTQAGEGIGNDLNGQEYYGMVKPVPLHIHRIHRLMRQTRENMEHYEHNQRINARTENGTGA